MIVTNADPSSGHRPRRGSGKPSRSTSCSCGSAVRVFRPTRIHPVGVPLDRPEPLVSCLVAGFVPPPVLLFTRPVGLVAVEIAWVLHLPFDVRHAAELRFQILDGLSDFSIARFVSAIRWTTHHHLSRRVLLDSRSRSTGHHGVSVPPRAPYRGLCCSLQATLSGSGFKMIDSQTDRRS